jgi:hypothetical protein
MKIPLLVKTVFYAIQTGTLGLIHLDYGNRFGAGINGVPKAFLREFAGREQLSQVRVMTLGHPPPLPQQPAGPVLHLRQIPILHCPPSFPSLALPCETLASSSAARSPSPFSLLPVPRSPTPMATGESLLILASTRYIMLRRFCSSVA